MNDDEAAAFYENPENRKITGPGIRREEIIIANAWNAGYREGARHERESLLAKLAGRLHHSGWCNYEAHSECCNGECDCWVSDVMTLIEEE